jgi:SAM-dependent methyltransferase
MRRLKAFLRKIQEFVERRVLGSYLQQFIWSTRHFYKKNWAQNFLDTSEHPHRKQIFEALYEFKNLRSVLDLGCGPGANLVAIRKKFPDIELIGLDINPEAIKVGRAYFASKGDDKVTLIKGKADAVPLHDESVDVVLVDALLMFITPNSIDNVVTETIRLAKKGVVINDYHLAGKEDGKFFGGRWIYDIESLIRRRLPKASIAIKKSDFVGGGWDSYGTFIVVHF